jgi:hypothetical protein
MGGWKQIARVHSLERPKNVESYIEAHLNTTKKWFPMVPRPLNFKWKNVWLKIRVKKNVDLIWIVWHQLVAINVWCTKINKDTTMMCPCELEALECMIHRFCDCPKAKATWEWAFAIHRLHTPSQNEVKRKSFKIKQCLFTKKLPNNYIKPFSHI